MRSTDDSATSLSLLRILCQPEKDEAAWRVFYERYEPMIHRWCARFRLQAADVEDVSQKVLQRVFTRIGTYDPGRGERFRGWLKTVVENAVRDFLRTAARRPADRGAGGNAEELLENLAQPETVDFLVDELDSSLQRDLAAILAQVEQEVEPDTLRCFRQVVLDGQPIADVAAGLGKSYAAVCMAIHRVKIKLRAAGARLGGGEDSP
jgi:RNA polymerase sigma factor (sigma-70 family)